MFLKKNTASQTVCFGLINASTGAALTGATVSVRRCLDGTFAATTGTVTEDSGGLYKFAPSQADTNGDQVSYYFTGAAAVPVCLNLRTTAADMADTVRFGLTALPNVASGSAGALITSGTGTAQLSVTSGVASANVTQVAGQTASAAAGVTFPASIGTSTLTQAEVTGGSYALNSASFAFNAALDFTTAQKAATLARVTLTDTVTTYTGNTPQTGDSFARIGATGSGLTSLAPAATALSTATWTGTLATNLATTNTTVATNLDAAVSSRSTYAGADTSGTTTLLSRLSSARAGYLDNLSGGAVMLAASYSAPPSAATNASAVRTELATELARIDVATSTRLASASYTAPLDAAGTRTAVGLTSANLDTQLGTKPTLAQILAGGDVDGYTLEEVLRLVAAALVGKLAGAATTTVTIRSADDSKTRVTAVCDADGNRTSVTLDATP